MLHRSNDEMARRGLHRSDGFPSASTHFTDRALVPSAPQGWEQTDHGPGTHTAGPGDNDGVVVTEGDGVPDALTLGRGEALALREVELDAIVRGVCDADAVEVRLHVTDVEGVSLALPVTDVEGVSLALPVTDVEGVSLALPVTDVEGVSLALPVTDVEGVSLALPVIDIDGVGVCVPDTDGAGVRLTLGVTELDPVKDGDDVKLTLGVSDTDGVALAGTAQS